MAFEEILAGKVKTFSGNRILVGAKAFFKKKMILLHVICLQGGRECSTRRNEKDVSSPSSKKDFFFSLSISVSGLSQSHPHCLFSFLLAYVKNHVPSTSTLACSRTPLIYGEKMYHYFIESFITVAFSKYATIDKWIKSCFPSWTKVARYR